MTMEGKAEYFQLDSLFGVNAKNGGNETPGAAGTCRDGKSNGGGLGVWQLIDGSRGPIKVATWTRKLGRRHSRTKAKTTLCKCCKLNCRVSC